MQTGKNFVNSNGAADKTLSKGDHKEIRRKDGPSINKMTLKSNDILKFLSLFVPFLTNNYGF